MVESQQVLRQWRLLQQLAETRQGISLRQLAASFQVSDRTLRRDLVILQTVGFPLEEVTAERGLKRWKMRPFGDQLAFHLTDMVSILMSRRLMEPLAGTPFWEGHQRVLRKIRAALGDRAVSYCDKLSEMLRISGFGSSNYSQRGAIIDALMLGMEEGRRVRLEYQSAGNLAAAVQDVVPRGLIWHNGSLYLAAWSVARQEYRTYKVDRMLGAEVGELTNEGLGSEFSLPDWQSRAFGVFQGEGQELRQLRIQFAADAARYVQESWWHSSQQITARPDGTVELTLELNDYSAVSKWILGFGSSATVLTPPDLVQRMREELDIMRAKYGE